MVRLCIQSNKPIVFHLASKARLFNNNISSFLLKIEDEEREVKFVFEICFPLGDNDWDIWRAPPINKECSKAVLPVRDDNLQ